MPSSKMVECSSTYHCFEIYDRLLWDIIRFVFSCQVDLDLMMKDLWTVHVKQTCTCRGGNQELDF